MKPGPKRTLTAPGLGISAADKADTDAPPPPSARPKSSPPLSREEPGEDAGPASTSRVENTRPISEKMPRPQRTSQPYSERMKRSDPPVVNALSRSAPVTDTRRRTLAQRSAVTVDDVGSGRNRTDAVGLAGRAVPKIVRTKEEIAAAPIDHRAGFLLAHVDGVTSVQGLVDVAGMPEADVHAILERLRRLGIVTIR
jgi:hypothetical protein